MDNNNDSYHFVLTKMGNRGAVGSIHGLIKPSANDTRETLYRAVLAQFDQTHPNFPAGIVTFFSLEPNRL